MFFLHRDFRAHTIPANLNEQILVDQHGKTEKKGGNKGRKEKDCSAVMQ